MTKEERAQRLFEMWKEDKTLFQGHLTTTRQLEIEDTLAWLGYKIGWHNNEWVLVPQEKETQS